MKNLSQRLLHLADMVTEGSVLADIGTDHAYVPIYLLKTGRIRRAFAMDIGSGPLLRAREHVEAYGLGDYITLRLSDGAAALEKGEADSVLIAGMGGGVTLHILREGEEVIASAKELILQPQSEMDKVRRYLYEKGYVIDREDMVLEDGKYYSMMHIPMDKKKKSPSYAKKEWQMVYRFGEPGFYGGNDVWRSFLLHRERQYEEILEKLMRQEGRAVRERRREIKEELSCIRDALEYRKEERQSDC